MRFSEHGFPQRVFAVCIIFEYIEEPMLHINKWRKRRDSNPGRTCTLAGFQDQCIRPLCHASDYYYWLLKPVHSTALSLIRDTLNNNG